MSRLQGGGCGGDADYAEWGLAQPVVEDEAPKEIKKVGNRDSLQSQKRQNFSVTLIIFNPSRQRKVLL